MDWPFPLRPPKDFPKRHAPGQRKDLSSFESEVIEAIEQHEQRGAWNSFWASMAWNLAVLASAGLILTQGFRLLSIAYRAVGEQPPTVEYHRPMTSSEQPAKTP